MSELAREPPAPSEPASEPPAPSEPAERLFSYGTLQQREVQLTNFGRELTGRPDALVGFRRTTVQITDPRVVAVSGSASHPIVAPAEDPNATVPGTVFELTADELAAADAYEVGDYARVEVTLASGARAWVYLDGRPPG